MFTEISDLLDQCFSCFAEATSTEVPDCGVLNYAFHHKNYNLKQLKFFPQDSSLPYAEMNYEERIFEHGLIATRKHNWHDFFNAMVWKTFPQTKSAINALHHQELLKQDNSLRSRKRDLLTLFDESGVIIVADKYLLDLIKKHQWHELFVKNRQQWLNGSIQIKTFGHALYEKYRSPYIGLTAQALLLESNSNHLDAFLSHGLINQKLLNSKTELSPLPLLGIPLWHSKQDESFYQNTRYFR